jgi:hypothetical protein
MSDEMMNKQDVAVVQSHFIKAALRWSKKQVKTGAGQLLKDVGL